MAQRLSAFQNSLCRLARNACALLMLVNDKQTARRARLKHRAAVKRLDGMKSIN